MKRRFAESLTNSRKQSCVMSSAAFAEPKNLYKNLKIRVPYRRKIVRKALLSPSLAAASRTRSALSSFMLEAPSNSICNRQTCWNVLFLTSEAECPLNVMRIIAGCEYPARHPYNPTGRAVRLIWIASSKASSLNGLNKYSSAPFLSARTRAASSPCAVIKMTGISHRLAIN